MPAHKMVSAAQERLLLNFMQANPALATGRVPSHAAPLSKQQTYDCWVSLASTLNAVGSGTTKTPVKWRDYWAERKYAVRKKAASLRAHAAGTGGGLAKTTKLTDVEEEILSIIGKVSVYGEPSVQIPFDDPPSASQGQADTATPTQSSSQQLTASSETVSFQIELPEPVQSESSIPHPQSENISSGPSMQWHMSEHALLGSTQRQSAGSTPSPVRRSRSLQQPLRATFQERHHQQSTTTPEQRRPPVTAAESSRRRIGSRINVGAPQWALDIENRRLEMETLLANSIERLATAAEESNRVAQATGASMERLAVATEELADAAVANNRMLQRLVEAFAVPRPDRSPLL